MKCPKCSGTMRIKGAYWICSNSPFCSYRKAVKEILSYEELLEENKRQKETIAKLVKELSPNIP